MRNLVPFLLCLPLFFSSCSSSNDVAQDGLFQKRKYRQGIHSNFFNKKINSEKAVIGHDSIVAQQQIGEEDSNLIDLKAYSPHIEAVKDRKTKTKNHKSRPSSIRSFDDVQKGVERIQEKAKIKWELRHKSFDDDDPEDAQGLGIGSIVVAGLTILIFSQIPIIGLVLSVVAIILGNRARDGGAEKLGRVGYVLGLCALGLSILFTIFYAILIYLVIIGFI
ncbi:MAG: hypothetical protein Salg2KO_02700 [Salibacteraceae bacterium]